ncbi:hypothetical protein AMECASPLE_024047 [Ameca splendens]|uniref:Uncharacterized protein n=1 Tax=Ameca splendens TaxID=208324 RepID=A0ABV0ZZT4_9TELE
MLRWSHGFLHAKVRAGLHHDTLALPPLIGRAKTGKTIACGYVPCPSQPSARDESWTNRVSQCFQRDTCCNLLRVSCSHDSCSRRR